MNFKELLTSRNIIILVILIILILAIYLYSTRKPTLEKFTENAASTSTNSLPTAASGSAPFKTTQTAGLDKPDPSSTLPNRVATNPNDLLPSNTSANWGNLYPVQNDGGVYVPSLTEPSFQIGINSISSTLKNPSLDLRSEPIIPKQQVGPWNNSSYSPNIAKIGLDPHPSVVL
jgi:hypothetical protein